MITRYTPALCTFLLFPTSQLLAQCNVGEVEVTIEITTDAFGYETYWQLVPNGNACGTGTIFEGGNLTIGCAGGGLQDQDPSGYANDTTYVEGPWCLVEGELYDIHMIDDWGDGQAGIEVFVNGESAVSIGAADGILNVYTFMAAPGAQRDMTVLQLYSPLFTRVGGTAGIRGSLKSLGSDPVTDIELSYSVDGGPTTTASVGGLALAPGDVFEFVHPTPWIPILEGSSEMTVWVSSINGLEDERTFNDVRSSQHVVSAAMPDLADAYLAVEPLVTVVANSDQDILVPRDLDFHPEAARNQLWVINKGVAGFPGGSTVTFYHPGENDQTFEWRQDVNSGHFMSLPTALAMADNNNFATSPGVFDAQHNGGIPFTGPSLWSADTAVYCRFYGGLGSHLDMLHVNPNSQGIAHDFWNRFWVVDGYTGDIVMNDFRADHGPGNDYHGNGFIRRYADFTITRDTNDHIVSHDVMDKSTGWLYVVDHGGQRVLRMNVNSGTVSGPATEWNYESVAEYVTVAGYEWEEIISEDLVEPAGIEIVGTHLYVSDHANGDIIIYDISGANTPELGRIHTNIPGLMGIVAGPDGRIWGVNATTHQLLRMDPQDPVAVADPADVLVRCWPNPATDRLVVELPAGSLGTSAYSLRDASGRTVQQGILSGRVGTIAIHQLPAGAYALELKRDEEHYVTQVAVVR